MIMSKAVWTSLVLGAALMVAGPAFAQGAQPAPAKEKNPVVVIETSVGDITVELDAAKAPLSVANFLGYVKDGFYSGTIFHRVIKGFMVQGGGMTADGQKKPTKAPIRNEATNGLSNVRGTIAMARTNEINSATSQFFINTVDNIGLNYKDMNSFGYCVFGKVTAGMDVVDKIEKAPTKPGDWPVDPVVIKGVKVK
jgi:peptidyl-prolyl cis-trans isomerase A (cyclophilin A)